MDMITTTVRVNPLRQRMQHDMMMRGLGPHTQHDYIRHVRRLVAFLGRPPDTATADDLRSFQIHQHERGASASTINGAVSALRFFYGVTLKRQHLARSLVATRRPHRMREVLSVEEAARLFDAAPGIKYKAALGVAYGAGLRVSEVAHLKVDDIDSARMLIRVEQGKPVLSACLAGSRRGRQGPQRHALAATAGTAPDVVARGQAARRDVPAWLAVPGAQLHRSDLVTPVAPRRSGGG